MGCFCFCGLTGLGLVLGLDLAFDAFFLGCDFLGSKSESESESEECKELSSAVVSTHSEVLL